MSIGDKSKWNERSPFHPDSETMHASLHDKLASQSKQNFNRITFFLSNIVRPASRSLSRAAHTGTFLSTRWRQKNRFAQHFTLYNGEMKFKFGSSKRQLWVHCSSRFPSRHFFWWTKTTKQASLSTTAGIRGPQQFIHHSAGSVLIS